MQTLESLGVPATFLIPHTQHTMPEAPNAVPPGWVHPQQQGFPTMDQQQGVGLNQPQSNHIFVMNNVKPEQSIPRREEAITSPPPPSPSVITATYNPTYNRCLPKILSDLDCEMKIKQVLRCIENILLENGDVDLQQQAYKLPDRSSSPQFAKSSTKKPKFKEDEEMLLSPNGPAINLPLATNSPASLINKASASKNPIKINVKVEPEAEKAAQHGVRPPFPEPQSLPNGSPRAQMFDFSYKQHQSPAPQGFPQQAHVGQPQRFGFDNSYSSPSPSHPPHPAQPMIPHIQLSMSSPHLTAPSATNSPHLHHLHASSPHIHNSHVNSPHLAHSPLAHANSPHLVHSPHPHSPLVASQASPHLPSASPLTQFQVITNPNPHPEPAAHSDSMMSDFQYPPLFDGVQAGGHPAPQKKEHNMQDYVLDPALFAQYLAQNQQQLQQLQQQLHQQQQQHNQLQQQQRLQQHAPSPAQPTTSTTPAPSSAAAQPTPSTQAPAAASASANASAPAAAATTSTTTAHQPPVPINAPLHLFDTAHHPLAGSAHPITLSGHMSFSGHLLNQIGPDGIRLEEDDKWILSLLNMDSNIAHDLSLSGHIPPL